MLKYQTRHVLRAILTTVFLGTGAALHADIALQAFAGGDVVSSGFPVTQVTRDFFFVALDGGAAGTPTPAWLSVDQTDGYTDAAVSVFADPAKLQPGTYSGRIVVTFETYSNTVIQNVTLTVTAAPPKLTIEPSVVALTASSVTGVNQTDSVAVYLRNIGGGGPQPFTAAIVGDPSYLTLSATSGQTDLNHPVFTVTASTKGALKAKAYAAAVVRVTSGTFTQDIPITFLVMPSPQSFGVTKLGLLFRGEFGVNTQQTQTIQIPAGSGTVNWTVSVTSAQDFVNVTPINGTSTPGAPGVITVGIKPNTLLMMGSYYALITVTPNVSGVLPVLATVVYIVTPGTAYPTFSPSGLVFVAPLNTPVPGASQSIPLYASTSTPQRFTVGQGGNLFDSITTSGTVTGAAPVSITVTPAAYATSKPGIFRGNVQVKFPNLGITRTTDVLYVVLPQGVKPAAALEAHAVTGCTPTAIALLATALSSGFSQPAGFPAVISMRVVDDCSNPVTNAKVVLSFSDGDPPLIAALEDSTTGTYTATWVPSQPSAGVIVTARATAGAFSASVATTGVVPAQAVPMVALNGTISNRNPHVGGPLSPGNISEIYGSGLSSSGPGTPSQLPLPNTFNNTSVQVAAFSAPLYYVSDGQLDVQLPAELAPNASYPLVVTNGNAISVPRIVTVTDVSPGVAATTDGQMISQHADFTYVTAASPAKPGEVLIMYLVGLGATNPPVQSGIASPGIAPLPQLVNSVTVTVDGESSIIRFAGLTPGAVGLYQINFTIPLDARNGNLNVAVTQNGVATNITTIPVAR